MGGLIGRSRQRILVVEDETLIRMDAVAILEDAGYETLEAADAASALLLLETGLEVSVLFTDLNMPGLDGMRLTRIVHARWPHIHLLMTSGRRTIDLAEIPDHGLFLHKPYGPEELLTLIRSCLETPEEERSRCPS